MFHQLLQKARSGCFGGIKELFSEWKLNKYDYINIYNMLIN